jgi:hypothetical protein
MNAAGKAVAPAAMVSIGRCTKPSVLIGLKLLLLKVKE